MWTLFYSQGRTRKEAAKLLDVDEWAVSEALLSLRHSVEPPLIDRLDEFPEGIRDALRKRLNQCFVYFIRQEGTGLVKIGYAKSPASRLRTLQVSSPQRLSIAALEPGGRSRETFLHDIFADWRFGGEWFKETQQMTRYINEIRKRHSFCNTINNMDTDSYEQSS